MSLSLSAPHVTFTRIWYYNGATEHSNRQSPPELAPKLGDQADPELAEMTAPENALLG